MIRQLEFAVPATRYAPARRVRRVAAGLVALTVVSGVAMAGCSAPSTSSAPSTGAAPTSTAVNPPNGSAVTVDQFAAATQRAGVTVVDVRTPQEFAQGHLAGAVNIDVSAPDFGARLVELARTRPYAVYCHSGNRSAVAVSAMTSAGFTDVVHLAGGVAAWTSAGRALKRP